MKLKLLISFVMLSALGLSTSLYAINGQVEVSSDYTDTPPTIDGVFTPGEWPATEAFVIDSPIHTRVYISNDDHFVYLFVDAATYSGDYTQDTGDDCDVVLYHNGKGIISQVFGDQSRHCEITHSATQPLGWSMASCTGKAMAGFGPSPDTAVHHRMYEFKVPLSSFNAAPGDIVSFGSPGYNASMPHDASSGMHNDWPENSIISYYDTWALLHLAKSDRIAVPTLSQWGTLSLLLLMGSAALWTIRRRKEFPA